MESGALCQRSARWKNYEVSFLETVFFKWGRQGYSSVVSSRSRHPLHALCADWWASPEAPPGDCLRHGNDWRLLGLRALWHAALQPALPQRDLPSFGKQRQAIACLWRRAHSYYRFTTDVILWGIQRSYGKERGGRDGEATRGDAWNVCCILRWLWARELKCWFLLQVSPLFGTIYNSILFMAHAVHHLRQSGKWMSGGNLARQTQNLAIQVL